jgi:hypothetical protein
MKALRTKVILSGIVLVFAFIATIGTTFAWFTVSQTATVETLTLNVTAEDSLLIQVAADNASYTDAPVLASEYQTNVSNTDINALYTDFESYRLRPVTAVSEYFDTSAVALTPFSLRTILSDDAKTINAVNEGADLNSTTGRYIELRFFLLYQSADNTQADLILSSPSVQANNGTTELDNVVDAVRLGIKVTGTDGTTPYTGTEFIFGETNDFGFAYQAGDDGFVDPENGLLAFNALDEISMTDGSGILNGTNVSNASNVQTFATATASGSETALATIYAGEQTMVTVRIFVEGWASATTDEIIEAFFDLGFGFAITNEQ